MRKKTLNLLIHTLINMFNLFIHSLTQISICWPTERTAAPASSKHGSRVRVYEDVGLVVLQRALNKLKSHTSDMKSICSHRGEKRSQSECFIFEFLPLLLLLLLRLPPQRFFQVNFFLAPSWPGFFLSLTLGSGVNRPAGKKTQRERETDETWWKEEENIDSTLLFGWLTWIIFFWLSGGWSIFCLLTLSTFLLSCYTSTSTLAQGCN